MGKMTGKNGAATDTQALPRLILQSVPRQRLAQVPYRPRHFVGIGDDLIGGVDYPAHVFVAYHQRW